MASPRVVSIDELIRNLQEAWNRHDMQGYTASFAPDAVYVNAIGTIWRGHEEIERGHLHLHGKVFRESTITSMKHSVTSPAPGVAVCVCEWEMAGVKPPEGWAMGHPRRGVMILVLVNQEGAWIIASGQNTEKTEIDLSRN